MKVLIVATVFKFLDFENNDMKILKEMGYEIHTATNMNEADGGKEKLISEYEKAFEEYCRDNRIVSEFVRFHPIIGNGVDFQPVYCSQCIRHTVGTNLKDYDDPIQDEFSKKCRKRVRRAISDGITYNIIERPKSLDDFKDVYYATMERNGAGEYYYFSDEYFSKLMDYFGDNLLLVEVFYEGKVIAASLNFVWNGMIHVHLSGTLSDYIRLSPAYVLKYVVAVWGKEHGYELIHYGGGRSNDENDSLYTFKKQFGKNTSFDFYVGRKIWNKEVYDELCKLRGIDRDKTEFFPAYRA